MKACPFCAEEIQDAAIACKHCGREFSNSTAIARISVARSAKDFFNRATTKRLLLAAGSLAVVLIGLRLVQHVLDQSSGTVSQAGTGLLRQPGPPVVISIASASDIDIDAGKLQAFDWVIPNDRSMCHLTGHIEVTSGGNRDVQVFVTTADEYKNLLNGHATKTYFGTEKMTVVNLDVRLTAPGPMVLAIGNTFSTFTGKRVQLRDVKATCT